MHGGAVIVVMIVVMPISKGLESLQFRHFAEDAGFEPARAFTQHAFQACAIGH